MKVGSPLNVFLCVFLSLLATLLGTSYAMMTIEQENELGRRLLKEVKARVPFVEDQEVVQYVRKAGQEVLKVVPDTLHTYRFFVIKDQALNAFAMPGGYIFVHSGLLEEIDTEDELVCVLAHEIGHVEGRHIARRMERLKRLNIASAAAIIAGIFLGKGSAGSAILATTGALNASIGLKYSREDEEEADRRAFQWICRAGYNPRGLITMLEKMQKMRWLGTDAIPSYLLTHPGSAQRISYLSDLLKEKKCTVPFHKTSWELRRIQVRLSVDTRPPYTLIERFERELKVTPKDEFLIYGLSMARLKARAFDKAIAGLKRLIEVYPEHPEYQKDLGVALYLKGAYKEAAKVLRTFLSLRPKDLTARYHLAMALLEEGETREAKAILEDIYWQWQENPNVVFALGRAYADLDKKGRAHYYFFLYYSDIGEKDAAQYHRRMAIRLLPDDSSLKKRLMEKGEKTDDNPQEPAHPPLHLSGGSCTPSGPGHKVDGGLTS